MVRVSRNKRVIDCHLTNANFILIQDDYHRIYHRAIKFSSLLMEMTRFIYNLAIEYNFMTLALVILR